MGIPTFWASPFPKTLVIWASPSHNNLAIWVRVRLRVTGDAHTTRLFEKRPLCVTRGLERAQRKRAWRVIYFLIIIFLLFLLAGASAEEREVFHLNYKECLLLAVTRMEMNYNFKKLGQLFRQKNIKVPSYEPSNLLYFCLATI